MKDLLREAKKYARKGDMSRAGDLCDMAGHPLEAIEYYVSGRHYFLAAQIAERIGEYGQAATYYGQAGNHSQAAEMYLRSGQKKKASQMFEQSGQYLRAATLEEQMTNYAAAATYYELAGQIEKAAYLFARVGNNARAAALYEQLIESDSLRSLDSGAYNFESKEARGAKFSRFAGILYFKAGQYSKAGPYLEAAGLIEQAVQAYRKAGRTDRAADLLMRLENYSEALQLVEHAPNNDVDPKLLGELYLRSGRYEQAAEVFLSQGLKFRAAECFESAGNQEKAADLFAAEGEATRAADLFSAVGRHRDAAVSYEKAAETDHAGREYEKAGLLAEAARLYTGAGRTLQAARIHLKAGQQDQAIRILQEVQSNDESYGEASLLLGTLFHDQGLYAPAVTKFDAAQRYLKDDRRLKCLYHLALTYEQMGRVPEARRLYERILTVDYHHADVADRLKALAAQVGGPAITPTGPARLGSEPRAEVALPPPRDANISGRLEIIGRIGQGRHGLVVEAYDRTLGRKVAAKRYPPAQSGAPDMVQRFLREAKRISELNHPNLVNVHGVGEDGEGRYIIEELVSGRSLREILDDKIRIEPARIIEYATQICDLLAYVHRQGVMHRNLRPENIFILGDDQVKVSDFGLGTRVTDPSSAKGRIICYLAPEVIRSEKIDQRTDLYAFGIILYEMLLGEPPFPAETAAFDHLNVPPPFSSKPDRQIPRFLRKVIEKCLEKERARRYRSAEQVLDELKASALVPGAVIADRYEIVRELGIGGMGRIYQALDRDLDETVALKVLRSGDAEARNEERFVSEIKMTRRITHPNVVKVFDLGTWREMKYITMEYIDGVNLEQWVRLRSTIDVNEGVRLMVDIAGGLASAHALGIIHRDIKPQNILLKDGTIPKILDFGIARALEGNHMTTAGFVMGSPKYMSPEQIQAQPLDVRSDVYSLGVVMYFVFTGREPFMGESPSVIAYKHIGESPRPPRDINPDVPIWLSDLVLKALAKNRDERHATVEAMGRALRQGLAAGAAQSSR